MLNPLSVSCTPLLSNIVYSRSVVATSLAYPDNLTDLRTVSYNRLPRARVTKSSSRLVFFQLLEFGVDLALVDGLFEFLEVDVGLGGVDRRLALGAFLALLFAHL